MIDVIELKLFLEEKWLFFKCKMWIFEYINVILW
jgi:hypothetical protein